MEYEVGHIYQNTKTGFTYVVAKMFSHKMWWDIIENDKIISGGWSLRIYNSPEIKDITYSTGLKFKRYGI
jgi:hypothetical protein